MQIREKNRNEIIEHKKRLEKHKKTIEDDVKEVMTQEKPANENPVIKKKVIKKKKIDKKAMKEKQKATAEKVMDDARKGNINIEKNLIGEAPVESNVVITKEERAERFKRLHAMVQDMMKKKNE